MKNPESFYFSSACELLLAFLSYRNAKRELELIPESEKTMRLLDSIDKAIKKETEIKSFVKLELKNQSFNNIPPLLLALRLYLRGGIWKVLELKLRGQKRMNKSNKLVIINRAIPGGGKTSLTKQIEELAKSLEHSISVHSTDEYFIQIDEEGIRRYVFDKKKLNEYHQNNQEAFKQALENRIDIVVCDNTNFESWQSKPYTDMAREFGYKILLIDFKPRELELH